MPPEMIKLQAFAKLIERVLRVIDSYVSVSVLHSYNNNA